VSGLSNNLFITSISESLKHESTPLNEISSVTFRIHTIKIAVYDESENSTSIESKCENSSNQFK
jgi:hypothetical protein